MDIAKVTKSFYFLPLPLLVVIYDILEVTAAYYNIKMLMSQLENADDKYSSGQVTKKDLSIEQEGDKFEKTVDNLSGIGHVMLARDVMKKPISITDTTDLAVAAQIMNDKRISGLPVMDSENNLNGIVTRTDVVKALLETKKELVH